MTQPTAFDPCATLRELLHMLYDNGMLREAMEIVKVIDQAQLERCRGEFSLHITG